MPSSAPRPSVSPSPSIGPLRPPFAAQYKAEAWAFFEKHKLEHYTEHSAEITELERLHTAALSTSEVVRRWKQQRATVKLRRPAFELVINFIHDHSLWHILQVPGPPLRRCSFDCQAAAHDA